MICDWMMVQMFRRSKDVYVQQHEEMNDGTHVARNIIGYMSMLCKDLQKCDILMVRNGTYIYENMKMGYEVCMKLS